MGQAVQGSGGEDTPKAHLHTLKERRHVAENKLNCLTRPPTVRFFVSSVVSRQKL